MKDKNLLSTPRTRLHRARRKQGLVCITVPLHRAQIGTLVYEGWLPEDQRKDRAAIERALASVLHNALMPKTPFLIELRSR
jgi:hypothetical protein